MKRTKQLKFFPNKPIPDTRPRQLCPICDNWIISDQMDSHMRVIHFMGGYRIYPLTNPLSKDRPVPQTVVNAKIPDAVSVSALPPQPANTTCPNCGIPVRRLERHLRRAHSGQSNVQSEAPTTLPPNRLAQRQQPAQRPHPAKPAPQLTQPPTKPAQRQQPAQLPHSPPSSAKSARQPQPTQPPAQTAQRPQSKRRMNGDNTPAARRRTGVFYDDELFSVEFEGKCIGTAGSAKEGWEMIEKYKKKL